VWNVTGKGRRSNSVCGVWCANRKRGCRRKRGKNKRENAWMQRVQTAAATSVRGQEDPTMPVANA